MPLAGFHPTLARWFTERLGAPTLPQREGWPLIRAGRHTLIAAPTGTGKTLAAFLHAIDSLLRQGADLRDETQVLYVSPLKALSNDVQKNLAGPLAELAAMDPSLPEIRVFVRTGDTEAGKRAAMTKRPPHVLVTTPESLYILLTTAGGRKMLGTVKTVIVDEIHALTGGKRGSHLALSLERLEALTGPLQRIGLSATQKPLEDVGRFLVGKDRECSLVDAGHLRDIDVAIEVPPSPLETVCSHETWGEIYERIAVLVREHRTTLVFVNTRKLAERVSARLSEILGEDAVASHHGSLSKDRRLDAERRLKAGQLRALVATASLELGLDIGDVDLVAQVGTTWSIATFLQRVGRAGHGVGRVPKGRLFPLTQDELVAAIALVDSVRRRELDATPIPRAPLDILAQQMVAACVAEEWREDELFRVLRRAWPYRELTREIFDSVVALHTQGRRALLHRDAIGGRLMATKRARMVAVTCGGAIPDNADYRVLVEPEGTFVGTVHEDFAVESNSGDVFQLGTASWRVLRVEPGIVRVADAKGQIPNLPFWIAEAPARTRELAAAVAAAREELPQIPEVPEGATTQARDYLDSGRAALGCVPTQRRVVLERFFDETGGSQLVLHAPFGGRINRAWGLALRKRFCRSFGFELQAAANEDAILLSLSPRHAFDLDEVFDYLHPNSAEEVLTQAVLQSPLFEARWRWNAQRSLLVERFQSGRRVPAPLLRMRADDQLMQAFPEVLACPETLPGGDTEIPLDHPLVRQTIEDCLHEAMDVTGFLEVLRGLRDGTIARVAVDTPEPSPFARGILNAQPYTFLDDAPLEERRTQAVQSRRVLDPRAADSLGALDPDAVRRVREEAWPQPEDAEQVHEALLWMGYVTREEASAWGPWLAELAAAGRVVLEGDRWFAVEASRDPKPVLRGRLEALGPVFPENVPFDAETFLALERDGVAMRARLEGREAWCDRRLLARIHRSTMERLRREIEPVTASQFLRFLAAWQHVAEPRRLDGPAGVAEVVRKLAGFEIPAASWEASVLPARVRGYKREWLDHLTLSGEVAWGRLWGGGASAIRATPVCLLPREHLDVWTSLAPPPDASGLGSAGREVFDALASRGAMFPQEVARIARLLPAQVDVGLGELVGRGLVTCDSFGGLRALIVPASRRRGPVASAGRWSLFRRESSTMAPAPDLEFVAKTLLRRTGVVFRRTLLREKIPVPWRELVRVYRALELRGDVRGGRFVAGFAGEQYALPEAVVLMRQTRRDATDAAPATVSAADPLNFRGILTPDERVPSMTRRRVAVG